MTLRKGSEFDRAYAEGTVHNGPFFVLRVSGNAVGATRWGFAVGKRQFPKAVERNLLRRRCKSLAMTAESDGYDVVMTVKPGFEGVKFDILAAELRRRILKAMVELERPVAGA